MNELNVSEYPVQCRVCGRKLLVTIIRFGVSHDSDIFAMCADCIDWNFNYCKENPEKCQELKDRFAAMPDRPEQ
jgi:hypothetical protein